MGMIQHSAVLATTDDDAHADRLDAWIRVNGLERWIHRTPMGVNGYITFFMQPDGSKEGWSDSDDGDERRKRFISYLTNDINRHDFCPWDYVEVSYGEFPCYIKDSNVFHKDDLA